jgi:putative endonuclease
VTTRARGDLGEGLARGYLEQHGYSFITSKYYAKGGEIDLVMRDRDELVFVEVKLRTNNWFGAGAEAIGRTKRHRLRKACLSFIFKERISTPWRIDVVVVDLSRLEPSFEHLVAAVGED